MALPRLSAGGRCACDIRPLMPALTGRGRAGLLAWTLAACLATSACSAPLGASGGDIGKLRVEGQTTEVTVPALWASKNADGTLNGGIEPAQIAVTTQTSDPGYAVDLSSIEAKGAGKAWSAATTTAAAFATLVSGADPGTTAVSFTITGPIDGPSAGGLLTCGLLAALSGTPMKPDVTMTGTITPDGSIGIVGFIPRKVQAAAEAGYRAVVLPAQALDSGVTLPDGRTIQEYAASLGITIIPVRTVGEAFAALTDKPSLYPQTGPPPLGVRATEEAKALAVRAEARLRTSLADAPASTDRQAVSVATSALEDAQTRLASGDAIGAYGAAAFGAYRLERATGAATVLDDIAAVGTEQARTQLGTRAQAVLDAAQRELDRLGSAPVDGLEGQAALPTLMSWPVFAIATVNSVTASLAQATSDQALAEMGRIVAEEDLAVAAFLPDAERMVAAGGSAPASPDAAKILGEYRDLLDNAANANLMYARDALGYDGTVDGNFTDKGLSAAIAALDSLRATTAAGFGAVAEETSIAMTSFWLSTALVAGLQAYGIDDSPAPDTRLAFATEAQNASVDAASGTVDSIATILAAQGIDLRQANWSARWSSALSKSYRGTPETTEANWLAQSELWYDTLQAFILRQLAQAPTSAGR